MNYLITGGAGFIGSNLAHKLTGDITVIDKCLPNTGYNERNLQPIMDRIEFIESDIADYDRTKEAIEKADVIFNLAGMTSHINSTKEPLEDVQNNLVAQINFLENCRQLNDNARIVFTGTRGQYGRPEKTPVAENAAEKPLDVNGVNKSAAEKLHLIYAETYGMKITALRLTNIYGPRASSKNYLGFIGYFVGQALRGKPLEVFGGAQKRDILYIDDLIEAMLVADKPGEVFNIGSGRAVSVGEVANTIGQLTGAKIIVKDHPSDHGKIEVGDFVCDITKAKKLLGWEPKVNYKEGLTKTIEFYRKNGMGW